LITWLTCKSCITLEFGDFYAQADRETTATFIFFVFFSGLLFGVNPG